MVNKLPNAVILRCGIVSPLFMCNTGVLAIYDRRRYEAQICMRTGLDWTGWKETERTRIGLRGRTSTQ